MKKTYLLYSFLFFLSIFVIQNCATDSQKKPKDNNTNTTQENGYNETFMKTGWIKEDRYRAVVFIITKDECSNSSSQLVEEKIRNEATRNLQKELNPSLNRNASTQIKILTENSGKMIKPEKGCVESNVYFFDLEKNNLKSDFEKIKNLK